MHSFEFGLSFGLTIVHIIKSARERCFLRLLAVIDKKGAFSETCSIILDLHKTPNDAPNDACSVSESVIRFGLASLELSYLESSR